MKKTLSIFLCLIIVVSLFGCNVQNEDNLDNKGSNTATNEVLNNTSNSTEKTSNEIYNEPFPDKKVIDIHSLEELNKMREMLLCEDEEQLKEYLSSFGNAITNTKPTKEDLEMFVSLADRFSFVNIVDGELILMHYSDGISIDTGHPCTHFAFLHPIHLLASSTASSALYPRHTSSKFFARTCGSCSLTGTLFNTSAIIRHLRSFHIRRDVYRLPVI